MGGLSVVEECRRGDFVGAPSGLSVGHQGRVLAEEIERRGLEPGTHPMGCLATEPDRPAGPIVEPSPDLSSEDRAAPAPQDTPIVDLPLWYAALVAPPTWDEPSEATRPESFSRLFWRPTIARWPIDRRQDWGDRANALQDAGLDWKEAERLAFDEIMAHLRPIRR